MPQCHHYFCVILCKVLMSAVSKAVIGKAPSPYSQGCYFMGNTSPSLFKSHTGCICISLFLLCKLVLHSDSFKDSGFVIDITKSTRFRFYIHGKIQISKRLISKLSYFRIFLNFLWKFVQISASVLFAWKEETSKNIIKGKSILLFTVKKFISYYGRCLASFLTY